MGLTLKHVVISKAGTYHYRRTVPKDAASVLGKNEFKRLLGETEREALKNFLKINALYERLVEEARAVSPSHADATPLEVHRQAERRAAELADTWVAIGDRKLRGGDPEAADLIRDSALAKGVFDIVERQALNLLANRGGVPRPAPTIEDARRLYFAEKVKGDINEARRSLSLERVMGILAHAVESDRALDRLTREDARKVRDHMVHDLKMRPNTVKRYIADIRSMVNLGLRENDMGKVGNPFNGLPIKMEALAVDERHPIPEDMLTTLKGSISADAGSDLSQLWRMLEGTGCRLAEVAGLLVEDVKLGSPIPYLDVGFRMHRRVKNAGSVRRVPLIHVRKVAEDPKIAVHSLRHTMEDRLIRARVEEFDRNLVLGHSSGGMSERYGGPDARLEAAHTAMKAALGEGS